MLMGFILLTHNNRTIFLKNKTLFMSDFFVGEIRVFPMDWAPQGWHLCDGSTLPINGNQALFALLGTTYGGDGKINFGLPDLRGRSIVAATYNKTTPAPGALAGSETVTVSALPQHTHNLLIENIPGSNVTIGVNDCIAESTPLNLYSTYNSTTPNLVNLTPNALTATGAGAAHNNMQPFLVLNFCIATTGIFPPRQ